MRKLTLAVFLVIAAITSNAAGEFLSACSTIHVPGNNSDVFGRWWDPAGADNEMTLVADYTRR